ncbi:MAG TPA: TIM barrel protein [Streptosporangiaceae bacterium]|nr:TIM barrel protein [Streptosporangiaceae bacterium]
MSARRIAFSTLAFPDATLARAVALGSSWGYTGVELRLIDGELIDPSMPAAGRAAVRRTASAAGLPIVAVDSSIRLTDDDPGRELRQFLELASDWESPLVRVFGGALPGDGPGALPAALPGGGPGAGPGALPGDAAARRARLAAAARTLETAAGVAERLGVAIGVETHDSFSSARVVAELLALVQAPSVGAVWDSHHPHRMGERPPEIYADLGSRLLLAQVKDARRAPERADGWQLVLLGEGEVPVREMLTVLAAGGYPGWISVEWEKRWHPEIEEPEVALPQHLALLSTWMNETKEAA